MKPVIALVGCPNVGKSTLFNRLTRSRDAIVADLPGITRDRIYGTGQFDGRPYIVIDTGGITGAEDSLDRLVAGQVDNAVDEANVIFLLVDGRVGRTAGDEEIADRMRKGHKPVFIVVNKAEGLNPEVVAAEFQALGMGRPAVISAAHGDNVGDLMASVLDECPLQQESAATEEGIVVAIVGRPNVGKSTLVNCLLGKERVLAYDAPGTTRDSLRIPFSWNDEPFILVDTAGLRRRGRTEDHVEKISYIKALQAIDASRVTVLVLDATDTVAEQDIRLLGHILRSGKALVIAVNKWDRLRAEQRRDFNRLFERRLDFAGFVQTRFISALRGQGIQPLFQAVTQAYRSAMGAFPTARLTRILQEAVTAHPPPMVRGRRIKLRYAHQGGHNPPLIIVHGNQTGAVPMDYRRYLMNYFRQSLDVIGTPLTIEFKTGANPYHGRKNILTGRQTRRRHRFRRLLKKRH